MRILFDRNTALLGLTIAAALLLAELPIGQGRSLLSLRVLRFRWCDLSLRVRLVRELGREGRDFNEREGKGDILIKNVFGSQGEGERF